MIEDFLTDLDTKGRTPETVLRYRKSLERFYEGLPGDKRITRGTLDAWQANMLAQGLAPRTVNTRVSAANSLLEYCDRRELQARAQITPDEIVQPELTRAEYLRILAAARMLGRQRVYLMVKVFAILGLLVHDLPLLTVQAVREGRVMLGKHPVHIPFCLQKELIEYAAAEHIQDGPVFVNTNGRPLMRSYVTTCIRALSRDARVPEEKCNPRCLKRLCQMTQDNIRENLELMFEQNYERLLEGEQMTIGWDL